MTTVDVVGGVYGEFCIQPSWNQVYGSGGRAAAALTRILDSVRLHTYVAPHAQPDVDGLAGLAGFALVPHASSELVEFRYLHPLAAPSIRPRRQRVQAQQPFEVVGEAVLRFGMMEGDAIVRAGTAVYDPQSPVSPVRFDANGSSARRLAMVINASELRALTHERELDDGAGQLIGSGVDVVVVKMGRRGARVYEKRGVSDVPAYQTDSVFKIGSGDVFSAAFAAFWAVEGRASDESADLASRATARYCNTRTLPVPSASDLAADTLRPVTPGDGTIYLAGPFFSLAQRWMVEETRACLRQMGVRVFSPVHDVGRGPADYVAKRDLDGLAGCSGILALVDGLDAGTLFEVGFARKSGIPVVALAQDVSDEDLKMLRGTGCEIVEDFASAIYRASWLA